MAEKGKPPHRLSFFAPGLVVLFAKGQYLHEMKRAVFSHYDMVTIAETPGVEKHEA